MALATNSHNDGNVLEVLHLNITKDHVASRHVNIVIFAKMGIEIAESNGLEAAEADITSSWQLAVERVEGEIDSREKERLLAQIRCPLYHVFWQQRTNAAAYQTLRFNQDVNGFCPFSRPPRPNELQLNNGTIVFNAASRDLVVPGVGLLSLDTLGRLSFIGLAIQVISANPDHHVMCRSMKALWKAIVDKLFYYESDGKRWLVKEEGIEVPAEEYREALKRNPESDAGDQALPTQNKRQKTRSSASRDMAPTNAVHDSAAATEPASDSSTKPEPGNMDPVLEGNAGVSQLVNATEVSHKEGPKSDSHQDKEDKEVVTGAEGAVRTPSCDQSSGLEPAKSYVNDP